MIHGLTFELDSDLPVWFVPRSAPDLKDVDRPQKLSCVCTLTCSDPVYDIQ